ncbi:MAG TPA: formate--tetrahydrofolate ligase [Candidatus Latescibacteria bacterium]|nr:formate--tetrahydrofolate ligase [Candidatus Latescibacterota bacterium]
MLSDLEIAQAARMRPITEIAGDLGLQEEELEPYGKYKAKVSLEVLERLKGNPDGKLITVTAITPTPLGEGKTVTAIGLGQALVKIGKRACNTMREPSKGPTFGIKGGACGGGYSQVVPMEDINLHFTGDIHAVESAHNLLAAAIDASILHKNPLNINPLNVTWRRCVDVSDRALRDIVVGLGGRTNGLPRQTGYDITVATETMAILALTTGLFDLRERLGRIVIGYTYDGKPVTAEDLKFAGAMCVLLKDAIKPNLVQTLENTPCFIHAGPFANVAHGNNSILADKVALKLADYIVTESGFGADCGFEKMVNVKCRQGGIKLDCAVVVATVRALKMHGGAFTARPGVPLDKELVEKENMPALEKGCENLAKQIENVRLHGIPAVVAINKFTSDRESEIELVRQKALEAGAEDAVPIDAWAKGGEGCTELAWAVVKAVETSHEMRFLYPDNISIKEKIEIIATKIYGADGVDYDPLAERRIKLYTDLGYDRFPINMAKTHLSLSHDPNWKGVPKNYRFPIRDIRASVGAGFLYPIAGTMQTMPGLPSVPAATQVDIDETGKTLGLF